LSEVDTGSREENASKQESERASVSRGLDQPPWDRGRNFWSCGGVVQTGCCRCCGNQGSGIRRLEAGVDAARSGFRKSSGDIVTVEYGPAGSIAKRIERDEPGDVAIVTARQLEALETQGKIAKGSRLDIAGIAIGVAVRKGAPRPDIGTVEAFKRALLASRAIGYRDPATGSTSGIYAARMIDRLGIAQDMQSKTRLDRSEGDRPENVFQPLANGEIEMQIGQITEIVMAPGIELVGPLPPEIQNTTVLAAGVLASSKVPERAKALINFLSSPSTVASLKAEGFQPVTKD
jgi:molybdate transport system substrate-binding protein